MSAEAQLAWDSLEARASARGYDAITQVTP